MFAVVMWQNNLKRLPKTSSNMLNFLKNLRRGGSRTAHKLELVSVHIPKSAGTSFRHILKKVYGEEEVIRLDIPLLNPRVRINEELYTEGTLPRGVRVIHGHFSPAEVMRKFPETTDLPFITWLRDPVERVISNYFYLEKRLREVLNEEGRGLNMLSKMQRSLIEYARADITRNRQTKFLEGIDLEDFEFVAIQEHYAEDLRDLARHLGWGEVEEIKVNVTGKSKRDVPAEIREEIARLNAEDVALYQRALHLRQRRKKKAEIDLISIHIPKTAGTSFYKSLQGVYGPKLSKSFRRMHVRQAQERYGNLWDSVDGKKSVLHGHFTYPEVADIARAGQSKVVAWFRDPVDRLISNYHFFIAGLKKPDRNRPLYEANKHRIEESLLTYAQRPENRNLMTHFMEGISVEELYFAGVQEHYREDLERLARKLEWPDVTANRLNVGNQAQASTIDEATRTMLAELNQQDIDLYRQVLARRQQEVYAGI